MKKKSLISQMVNPVNRLTIQDLPAKLVEMSEEDLQQIVGGLSVGSGGVGSGGTGVGP
jgi:bacteriocin-like protein